MVISGTGIFSDDECDESVWHEVTVMCDVECSVSVAVSGCGGDVKSSGERV